MMFLILDSIEKIMSSSEIDNMLAPLLSRETILGPAAVSFLAS